MSIHRRIRPLRRAPVGMHGSVPQNDRADLALVPTPANAPARFEPYDPELQSRAFEIWSSVAGRSGSRTLRLLSGEYEKGTALPTAATINRWALDGAWAARSDANLQETHGRTLYELQVGWLAGLRLAQQTLLDAMAGEFDDLPFGGAGRIKSAEVTLRLIERAGLLAVLPQAPPGSAIDWKTLSPDEQEALARQWRLERKASGDGHR